MLGHIRSGTLEKFKEAFDKALRGGQGFAAATSSCRESYFKQFDEGCAGIITSYKSPFSFNLCIYPQTMLTSIYKFQLIMCPLESNMLIVNVFAINILCYLTSSA